MRYISRRATKWSAARNIPDFAHGSECYLHSCTATPYAHRIALTCRPSLAFARGVRQMKEYVGTIKNDRGRQGAGDVGVCSRLTGGGISPTTCCDKAASGRGGMAEN